MGVIHNGTYCVPDTLLTLFLILTAILKYCYRWKSKGTERLKTFSRSYGYYKGNNWIYVYLAKKPTPAPPLPPPCVSLRLHRGQWEHNGMGRRGERVVIGMAGQLSFSDNSTLSSIEQLPSKGNTLPLSPGQEGQSKVWPMITLFIQPWVNDWAHIYSQANLRLSIIFISWSQEKAAFALAWGDQTLYKPGDPYDYIFPNKREWDQHITRSQNKCVCGVRGERERERESEWARVNSIICVSESSHSRDWSNPILTYTHWYTPL